jgi:hypothetical protein
LEDGGQNGFGVGKYATHSADLFDVIVYSLQQGQIG